MKISIHIGAHGTYGDKLWHSLWKNKDVLGQHDIIMPKQALYINALPTALNTFKNTPATSEFEEMVLDQILDVDDCKRLVMIFQNAICLPPYVFQRDQFYANTNFKLRWLRNVFPSHDLEFTFGVRNPATFIQELCPTPTSYETLIGQTDLDTLLWSTVVENIRKTCPNIPLNVYAFEDTPLIWPKLMRTLCGASPQTPLQGELDILGTIMHREGLKRLRTYLEAHPEQGHTQRPEIFQAFLEKYVNEDALDTEIDLPGWDSTLIERLTKTYEDDLLKIEDIPGVNFILP